MYKHVALSLFPLKQAAAWR